MPALRGLTVAVGEWYARTLEICLVRNMRHLTECVVITSPQDDAVRAVVAAVPGARLSVTDAFTRHNTRFNKGLAIEEAGLDFMGRHGWILIHDADILLPDSLPLDSFQPGWLHGARRRMLEDPSRWHPGLRWAECPVLRDGGPVGFFQAFHAGDPAIKDKRPWYDVSFGHAGGGDAYMMEHWPNSRRKVLPIDVLHLGKVDLNWMGTDPEGRDLMARFVHENQWRRGMKNFDAAAVARAGELPGRVEVPGYPPSNYELPFVKRTRAKPP